MIHHDLNPLFVSSRIGLGDSLKVARWWVTPQALFKANYVIDMIRGSLASVR
jgi:hypothetical protein